MKIGLSVLPALLLLVACGSSTPKAAAPSGDAPAPPSTASAAAPSSDPAAAAGSPEGGECSDDVAVQKKCAPGLTCVPDPKAPVSEHTPGICQKT